ncbi:MULTISPECIES: nuclear transport factor 2 family protein [unclassified Bradyrhizobium]|uniref:nuclear transport factor 2 family protein n=1 Tax=unclassified Bradyrhizobium TaxID=2631580 RepID=UPI001FEF2150|nr:MULTISPECIES: nuclear transport factor 2 family protein [unclassified Bradyrhizobium]
MTAAGPPRHFAAIARRRSVSERSGHSQWFMSTRPNKQIALRALTGAFINRDPNVVEHFTANYIQHNPTIPNGPAAIKDLIPKLPKDFSYQPGMVVAEGDLVMVHGRYVGWGPKPMIAVDMFRIEGGKVAEHWDVMQEEVPASDSANGNSMFSVPEGK